MSLMSVLVHDHEPSTLFEVNLHDHHGDNCRVDSMCRIIIGSTQIMLASIEKQCAAAWTTQICDPRIAIAHCSAQQRVLQYMYVHVLQIMCN